MEFIFPVKTYLTITQGYKSTHLGNDYGWNGAIQGANNQPIIAAESGTVVTAVDGWGNTYPNKRIYGNYVIVSHGNGYYTLYGHLLKGLRVKTGAQVAKGQTLGYMGNSGYSKGQHLHFEVRIGGNSKAYAKDPLDYVRIEDKTLIVSSGTLYPNRILYRQTSIGTPVPRDTTRNQIEVLISDLNVRTKPSIHGDRLGYATKGCYNYLETAKAGDYIWYEIEQGKWIASGSGWTNVYPAQTATLYDVTFRVTAGDVPGLQKYGETIQVTPTVTKV